MQETKSKGRPARDENDKQSAYCTIKDPLMEPYYIIKDSSNFTVMEKKIAEKGFRGGEASGKEREIVVGYFTSFTNALYKISKEKFYQNQGEYSSIKEYIDTWNKVKTGMDNLLKSIEI